MIELVLNRRPSLDHCTLGDLLVDGVPACVTIEDVVREIPGVAVAEWKIQGDTAIPAGRYAVVVTHSQRFGRDMPLLANVPGFSGVRIHPGNTAEDTAGCILVGKRVAGESIVDSRVAFAALFTRIQRALEGGEQVWIEVRNPEQAEARAA